MSSAARATARADRARGRPARREGPIGFVEELPGANTQGDTLEETRENLREAVGLVLDANRVLAEEGLEGEEFIREVLNISGA